MFFWKLQQQKLEVVVKAAADRSLFRLLILATLGLCGGTLSTLNGQPGNTADGVLQRASGSGPEQKVSVLVQTGDTPLLGGGMPTLRGAAEHPLQDSAAAFLPVDQGFKTLANQPGDSLSWLSFWPARERGEGWSLANGNLRQVNCPLWIVFAGAAGIFAALGACLLAAFYYYRRHRGQELKHRQLQQAISQDQQRQRLSSDLARDSLALLLSNDSTPDVLNTFCSRIVSALKMDAAALYQYMPSPEEEQIELRAFWSRDPGPVAPTRYPVALLQQARQALQTHPLLLACSSGGNDAFSPEIRASLNRFFHDYQVQTVVCLRLNVDGQPWGHIGLRSRTRIEFDVEERTLLEMIGQTLEAYLAGAAVRRKLNSETLLKEEIFESSPAALLLFDERHQLLTLNRKAAEIAGRSKASVLSAPCYQTFCAIAGIPDDCPVRLTLQSGQGQQHRRIISERVFTITTVPLLENNRVKRVLVSLADQTELDRSEQYFRETSDLLSAILNTLPCNVFVKDYLHGNRYILSSEYQNRQFGWKADYPIGKTDMELFGEEQGEAHQQADSLAMQNGRWEGDMTLEINGRTYYNHCIKTRIVRPDGKDLLLGVALDISDAVRQRAEIIASRNALHQSAARLETLLLHSGILRHCLEKLMAGTRTAVIHEDLAEHIGKLMQARYGIICPLPGETALPVVLWDAEGDAGHAVHTLCQSEGLAGHLRKASLISCRRGIPGGDQELYQELLVMLDALRGESLMCSGITWRGQLWGYIGFCRARNDAFTADDMMLLRECARIAELALLRDRMLAEIQEKNEKLQQSMQDAQAAARAKSLFLATMSHEIRTPLNAIIGFSNFMNRPELSRTEIREYTSGIAQAADALLNLINDVLDLSRLDSAPDTLTQGECCLQHLLLEMETFFREKACEKGLQLVFSSQPRNIPRLQLQSSRLRQILLNLLSNAIKFTPSGSVRCSAGFTTGTDGRGTLTLTVTDTGIGINPDLQKTLFDPFIQETTRGQKVYEGSGLGLAIVKRLADKIGARLTFTSTSEQGTSFTLVAEQVEILPGQESSLPFPAAMAVAVPVAPDPVAVITGNRRRLKVLLVDDVRINLRILAGYLKELSAECILASSAQEALDYLQDHSVDLIMTDIWMPEMSGAELTRKLKTQEQMATIPVIAVTADTHVQDNFPVADFAAILQKPLFPEIVRHTVAQVLGTC